MTVGNKLRSEAEAARLQKAADEKAAREARTAARQRQTRADLRSKPPAIAKQIIDQLRVKAKEGGGEVEWRWATYDPQWNDDNGPAVAKRVIVLLRAQGIECSYRPYSSIGTVNGDGYHRGDDWRAGEIKARI